MTAKLKAYDLRGAIPFSGDFTAQKAALNNRHRLKLFRKFMKRNDFVGVHALDIGKSNFISRELGIAHNTVGDLNKSVRAPSAEYDVITNLEVLNHVMNPLLLMQGCSQLLQTGGTMYLATPLSRALNWYHGRGNFAEYKPDRVQILATYAGFEVVRYETLNPWPFRFIFYGFRPPFRWLYNRFQMYELRKI